MKANSKNFKKFILSSLFIIISFAVSSQCNYTIELSDDYGDGWNGGTVTVSVNGVAVPALTNITLASGAGPLSFNIPVTTGQTITTSYTASGWPYENSYVIKNDIGTTVASDGLGGVNPTGIGTPGIAVVCQAALTPLSGVKTIGPSGDYASFSAAVAALNAAGVSGAVVFNVASGTYNEKISISEITGASPTNTITFQSASGDSTDVTLQGAATSSADGTVVLEGADYIKFKKMTIKTTQTSGSYRTVFNLRSTANYNEISNCVIQGSYYGSSYASAIYSYLFVNEFNVIDNNVIMDCYAAFYWRGTSSAASGLCEHNVISNNQISNYYTSYGMYLYYHDGIQVIGNTLNGAATYAIYGYYLDNDCKFSKNIINNTGSYGIRFYYCDGTAANRFEVSNNFISGATSYGIYDQYPKYRDYYYNSINVNNGSYGFYLYNSSSTYGYHNIKNNNFVNTGSGYAAYINNNSYLTSADYNNYYSPTGSFVYWQGAKADLSALKAAYSTTNQNSVSVDPVYTSSTDLHTGSLDLDSAGTPVALVTDDIDGEARDATTPDIGADEYLLVANDAGVTAMAPAAPCAGSNVISATIKNYGIAVLNNVVVNWSVNGVTQTPFSYTTPIAIGAEVSVPIGSYTFAAGVSYNLIFWTTLPNGVADLQTSNDSYTQSGMTTAMSGTYTIGGTSPDYATFAAALSDLTAKGVCGAVTFNIANGTYSEQISLGSINGSSAANTVTFKSASGDSSAVVITGSGATIIELNGTGYVTFKQMTLQTTATSTSKVVNILGGANNNTITNCRINMPQTSGSVYGVYSNSGLDDFNTYSYNNIYGGYYAMYLYGSGTTSWEKGTVIHGNNISGYYYYGILSYYQDSIIITNNYIHDPTYGYAGIYAYYNFNGFNISANRILMNGTYTSPYAIRVYSCNYYSYAGSSAPGLVSNNFITIQSTSGGYGFYAYYSNAVNYFYNSVNVSTGSSAYALYQGNTTSNTTGQTFKNNIFANNAGNYAAYFGTTSTVAASDYNDFYTTGASLAYWGGARADLSALQTASSMDANSVSMDPDFLSPTNLHTKSFALNDLGTPLTAVTTDIDGEVRSVTAPDIGADEYTPPARDISVTSISPFNLISGNQNIIIDFSSYGYDTVATVQFNYSVNGSPGTTPFTWSGSLTSGQSAMGVNIGLFNFQAGQNTVKAWPVSINGSSDQDNSNDTATYMFNIVLDAGIIAMDEASIQYGSSPVNAFIANYGTDNLLTSTVGWSVNGVVQTPGSWSGMLTNGNADGPVSLGNYNFGAGTYIVKIWTQSPNGITPPDADNTNDTLIKTFTFQVDAGISQIDPPGLPGTQNVVVHIKNFGTIPLTSATVYYQVNNGTPATYNWSGNIAAGAVQGPITVGTGTFNYGADTIKAWTDAPNGITVADALATNDTSLIIFNITADIGIVDGIIKPQNNCGRGNDTISLEVKNFGTGPVSGPFTISYKEGTSTAVTETVPASVTIQAGATYWHTFATLINLAVSGIDSTFNLEAWTSLATDANSSNDTVTATVDSWYTPVAPTTTGATVSYGTSAQLIAALTNGDAMNWYDAQMGGNLVFVGDTFNTPLLFDTTTYWVQAITQVGTGGNIAPQAVASASTCNTGACSTLNDLNLGSCGSQQMWISSSATNPGSAVYIQFVWPVDKTINKMTIHVGESTTRFLTGGTIQVWNGSAWIFHHSFTQAIGVCNYDINFPNVTTSQIRIIDITVGGSQPGNVNFREIEIFEVPVGCESNLVPVTAIVTNIPSDAGISAIDPVTSTGTQNVNVTLKNFTSVILNTASIDYMVNGTPGTTYYWSGSLGNNGTANLNIGSGTFTYGANTIKAWSSLPNGSSDPNPNNDTTIITFNIFVDIGVVAVHEPTAGCGLGNEAVIVDIVNFGTETVNSYAANFSVSGGTAVTESITIPLPPGDTNTYTFTATANLAITADSTFSIKAFTTLANDNDANNDTTIVSVLSSASPPAPVGMNDTINYGTSATLTATSSFMMYWFDAAMGGTEVAQGDTFWTPPLFDTTTYYVEARSGQADVKITEIVQYETGSGYTNPYPTWITGIATQDFDGMELTNLGTSPADISGYTIYVEGGATGNWTFPAGSTLPSGEVLVIDYKSPTSASDPSHNYYCISTAWNNSSSTAMGYYLKDAQGNIIDAVATNGYSFSAGSGVTSSDWSGNISSSSGRVGVSRLVSDNNTAADWGIAGTNPVMQSFGTMNPGFTVQGATCIGPRTAVTAIVQNFPALDVGVLKVNGPASGTGLTNAETLNITVKNFGTVAVDTIPVAYVLDAASPVIDTVFATLNPGDTANFSFATSMDLAAFATYNINTYTALNGDVVTSNDAANAQIIHSDYCISSATSNADDDIGNITIKHPVTNADLLNKGVASPLLNNPIANKLYSNFSGNTPTILEKGQVYPFSMTQIESGANFYTCSLKVYIDFNQDGILDPVTEMVYQGQTGPTASGHTLMGNITIPVGAALGNTRMRFVLDESGTAPPCGTYTWGETEDYTVNIVPQVWAEAGPNDTVCPGYPTTLTGSGTGPTYAWSSMDNSASTTVSPMMTTMYYLSVTDTYGFTAVDSTEVYARSLPILTFPALSDICVDASALTLNTATPAGGTYSGLGVSAGTFNPAIAGVGTHSITYAYADVHGCIDSTTQTITVNPLPVLTLGTLSDVCYDAPLFALTFATSPTGGNYFGPGVDASANFTAATAGAGTHYIKYEYTDANGCYNIDSTTQKVNALPVPTATATPDTVYWGTPTTLSVAVSGGTSFNYSWTPVDSLSAAGQASLQSPTSKNLFGPTTFTVVVTDNSTSCVNSTQINVPIKGGPLSTLPIAAPDTVCAGSLVQLNAQASGGSESYTYAWTSNPVGFTSSIAMPTVNPTVTTMYYVAINDGFNSRSDSVEVYVYALPTALTAITADSICFGDSVNLSVALTGMSPWILYIREGSNSTTVPGVTTSPWTTWVNPGMNESYYVDSLIDGNGCFNTSSAYTDVVVHSLPTLAASGSDTMCYGDSIQFTVTFTGQTPWEMDVYHVNTTQTNMSTESGLTSPFTVWADDMESTVHSITRLKDANGCQITGSPIDSVYSYVRTLPTVAITEDSVFHCYGDSSMVTFNLTGAGPWDITISDGTNSDVETVTSSPWTPYADDMTSMWYYITSITNANGCTTSGMLDSIYINVYPLPTPTFTGLAAAYCIDAPYDSLIGTPFGGTFSGLGITGFNFIPSNAGTGTKMITYTYTDANMCTNSTATSTIVNALPTITLASFADVCVDAASITLTGGSPIGGTYSTGVPPVIAEIGIGTTTQGYPFYSYYMDSRTQMLYTATELNAAGVTSGGNINSIAFNVSSASSQVLNSFTISMKNSTATSIAAWDEIGLTTVFQANYTVAGTGWQTINLTTPFLWDGTSNILVNICFDNSSYTSNSYVYSTSAPGLNYHAHFDGSSTSGCTTTNSGSSYSTYRPNIRFTIEPLSPISAGIFNPAIANIGANTVIYTYTDGNSCTNSDTSSITVHALPTPTFTGLAAAYCIDAIAAPLTGVPAGGIFSGTGIIGNSFDPATAGVGTHQIVYTYTDANLCIGYDTQSVVVNALPIVSFTGFTSPQCIDAGTTTLVPSPTGGSFIGMGISGNTFDPVIAGVGSHTITYMYSDANGCLNTSSNVIVVNAVPVVSFTGLNASYCSNEAASVLTGTPVGGTFSGTGITAGTFDPAVAGAGTYNIVYSYTDMNSCLGSDTQSVTVYAAPIVSFTGLQTVYCSNDVPDTLVGIPAGGIFTGAGISGNIYDPSMVMGADTVIYTYTDANMCMDYNTQYVMVNTAPVVSFSGLSSIYCTNVAADTLIGVPMGGTFTGSGINGNIFDPTLAIPDSLLTITYTFTDANGCTDFEDQYTSVSVTPLPVAGVDTSIACGDTVVLGDTALIPGVVYSWTPAIGLSNPSVFNPSAYPIVTTLYTLTVTDTVTNCSATASVLITVTAGPSIDAGADVTICEGDTAMLTVTGGVTYNWSNGDTTASISVMPTVTTTYIVTGINAAGCGSNDTVTVFVNPAPYVDAGMDATLTCGISSSVQIGSMPLTGFTYAWTPTDSLSDPTIANPMANPNLTTVYTVVVTNTATGCTSTDDVTIQVLGGPVAFAGNDTTTCFGDILVLTATGGPKYLWSTGDTTASITVTPTADKYYVVTVTDAGSNCASSDTVMVYVSHPMVDLGPDTSTCAATVVLDAGVGFASYAWSTGATTQMIVIDRATAGYGTATYSVTVTNLEGCTATDDVDVTLKNCTGLEEVEGAMSVSLYPNPTKGLFQIDISGLNGSTLDMCIVNMTGQTIFCEKLNNVNSAKYTKALDFSNYPKGVYFIRLTTKDVVLTERVIIQ
ncbi:MAG: lamin tail domain-containing protein [Saprospiraceae bacterium]|nr:lamin tail domain-containing protein [Saprospiraceae bacterium]